MAQAFISETKAIYIAMINHGGVTQSIKVFDSFDPAVTFLVDTCQMSAKERIALELGKTVFFEEGDNDISIWKCPIEIS